MQKDVNESTEGKLSNGRHPPGPYAHMQVDAGQTQHPFAESFGVDIDGNWYKLVYYEFTTCTESKQSWPEWVQVAAHAAATNDQV